MTAKLLSKQLTKPYPGLRPFLQSEEKLYFGRAEQITSMLEHLEDHRFLAVVGGSGSGKSSLVLAGLLPALREGYLLGAGTEWTFITMKPGGDPFNNLAKALLLAVGKGSAVPDLSDLILAQADLQASPHGFLEVLEQAGLPQDAPLLLLVDQFEEIFRFRRRPINALTESGERPIHEERNEATAFVNLLLNTIQVATEMERPIYVVLTMRSDFIGDCDAFAGLSQAVSNSQFLVPRMTRDQIQDAIVKPLLLFGCRAEPEMVNQIINEAGSFSDQLPLMQHALMRTWFEAKARRENGNAELILTLKDYQRVGRVSQALSRHLEEAWHALEGDGQKHIARRLFLCLSDRPVNGVLVRRMVKLGEVAQMANVDPGDVITVVHVFQANECNFIVSSPAGDLSADTVLDISHEALLRQWQRLRDWLNEEALAVQTYRRLAEAAALHEAGETSLWRDPELQRALQWREQNQPNEVWASRYHSGFREAMAFLSQSKAASEEEKAERKRTNLLESQRKMAEERNRRLRWGLIVVSGVSAISFIAGGQLLSKQGGALSLAKSDSLAASARAQLGTDPLGAQVEGLAALSGLRDDPGGTITVSDTLGLALQKNRPIGSMETGQGIVYSLLKLSNGELLSAGGDGTLRRWRWIDGSPVQLSMDGSPEERTNSSTPPIQTNQGAVLSLLQLRNGKQLISGGRDGTLQRWSFRKESSGKVRLEMTGSPIQTDQGTVTSLVELHNGVLVSGGVNGSLRFWRDDKPGKQIPTGQGTVTSLVELRNGQLISVGADGSLRYWLNGSQLRRKINTEQGTVTSLVELSNGKVISGGGDGSLRRWVNGNPKGDPIHTGQGAVRRLVVLNNGELISVGADGSLRRWRDEQPVGDGQPILTGQTAVTSLVQLHNGELISASPDGILRRWRLNKDVGKGARIPSEQGQVRSLVELRHEARKGVVVSGGGDGSLRRWSNGSPLGKKILTKQAAQGKATTVTSLLELQNGELISGGDDGSLRRWGWRNGEPEEKGSPIRTGQGAVLSLIQLRNKELISGGADGSLRRWNDGKPVGDGKPIFTEQRAVLSLLELEKSHELITGGADGTLRRWRNGKPVGDGKPIQTGQGTVISLLELQKGEFISGGGNGSLRRWRNGESLGDSNPIPTGQGWVRSLVKLKNNEVISGGFDGTLRRWRDGEPVGDGKPIPTYQGQVISLLVLREDAGLISGGEDGSLWWVRPGDFIRKACFDVPRGPARVTWSYLIPHNDEASDTCSRPARPVARGSSLPSWRATWQSWGLVKKLLNS